MHSFGEKLCTLADSTNLIQDQKEQVKTISKRLVKVFDFLEWTLLRRKVSKKEHRQRSKESVRSAIPQVGQQREVIKKKGVLSEHTQSVSRPFPLS